MPGGGPPGSVRASGAVRSARARTHVSRGSSLCIRRKEPWATPPVALGSCPVSPGLFVQPPLYGWETEARGGGHGLHTSFISHLPSKSQVSVLTNGGSAGELPSVSGPWFLLGAICADDR